MDTHLKMDAPDSTTIKMASLKAPPDPLEMDDPLDPTLTAKNIILSLRDIWRWFQLGISLEFKVSQLKRVKQDTQTTEDRITEIVGEWLRIDPLASWKKLVDALKAMEEHRVAFNIVTDYPELKRRHEEEEKDNVRKLHELQSRVQELEQQRLDEEAEWEKRSQEWRTKLEAVQRDYAEFEDNRENKRERLRREFSSKEYKERAKLLADSRIECENLQHIGERIDVLVERGRMLKDRERNIKIRQQKWKEAAEELESLQDRFQQNEEELSTRLGALSQLGEELLLNAGHRRFEELKESMRKCRERVGRCQGKLQNYQQYLRSDATNMSECHIQLESTRGELSNLKYGYKDCIRKTQYLQKELSKQKDSLRRNVARNGGVIELGATGAVTGALTGAVVGSVLGPLGLFAGYWIGAIAGGYAGGHAAQQPGLLKSELEICEQELKLCVESVEKGETLLERMREMNSEDD